MVPSHTIPSIPSHPMGPLSHQYTNSISCTAAIALFGRRHLSSQPPTSYLSSQLLTADLEGDSHHSHVAAPPFSHVAVPPRPQSNLCLQFSDVTMPGKKTVRFVSHSADNPDRVFIKCKSNISRQSKCKFFIWEDECEEFLRNDLDLEIAGEVSSRSTNEVKYDVEIGEWKKKDSQLALLFEKLIFLVALIVFLLICILIVVVCKQ